MMIGRMKTVTFEGKPALLRLFAGKLALMWQDGYADIDAASDTLANFGALPTEWTRTNLTGWTITETEKPKVQ